MKSMFGELNQWLLGDLGRYILNSLNQNKLIFLTAFTFYGFLLLYSKIIYMYYIPRKMKTLVMENSNNDEENLLALWNVEKSNMPNYILVPTKNEMWVKRLNRSNGEFKLLYFNRRGNPQNEANMLRQFLKK